MWAGWIISGRNAAEATLAEARVTVRAARELLIFIVALVGCLLVWWWSEGSGGGEGVEERSWAGSQDVWGEGVGNASEQSSHRSFDEGLVPKATAGGSGAAECGLVVSGPFT